MRSHALLIGLIMNIKNIDWRNVGCSAIASAAISFLVVYIFYHFMVGTNFINSENCFSNGGYQLCYYGENGVWSDAAYLQTISSFYTSLITVLIAIIALVGVVATLSLRASVRAHADQEIPTFVKAHFETIEAHNSLSDLIEGYIRNSLANNLRGVPIVLPENGELAEAFKALERRLDALEQELMEMRE
ncbi:hypothetical protein [Paenochrobactrum glaciei]|uniref:Transmembrane protein n=1 Tax=Paenochrobactrum glaciei TaxID=486407 RepID=A0ABN1GQ93_9HYPH